MQQPRRMGVVIGLVLGLALLVGAPVAGAAHADRFAPQAVVGPHVAKKVAVNTSGCLAAGVIHCYTPGDITAAYGVDKLHTAGWTGAGQTIVVVDSYGSPTASADLH